MVTVNDVFRRISVVEPTYVRWTCPVPLWNPCQPTWYLVNYWNPLRHDIYKYSNPIIRPKQLELWHIGTRYRLPGEPESLVNRGVKVSLLLLYTMEAKDSWNNQLNTCLVAPEFNVDVIWANVNCLLLHAILVWQALIKIIKDSLSATALSMVGDNAFSRLFLLYACHYRSTDTKYHLKIQKCWKSNNSRYLAMSNLAGVYSPDAFT